MKFAGQLFVAWLLSRLTLAPGLRSTCTLTFSVDPEGVHKLSLEIPGFLMAGSGASWEEAIFECGRSATPDQHAQFKLDVAAERAQQRVEGKRDN